MKSNGVEMCLIRDGYEVCEMKGIFAKDVLFSEARNPGKEARFLLTISKSSGTILIRISFDLPLRD